MKCRTCGQDNEPGMRFCVACGETLSQPAPTAGGLMGDSLLASGTVLKATYEIIRPLGEGGAGAVYEARHVALGHAVAVKVLFRQLARIPSIRERFVEEGRIQANLRHPNIVSVTDIVDDGSTVAIVMEFVNGETLHHFIQRQKQATAVQRAVNIMLRLLSGLGAAHKGRIVHRDIKPGNIMLAHTEQGAIVPKLTDFGIAKIASTKTRTMAGTKMGTLHYMAPEQLQDAATVDARADIYSMGVTFFELLTGRLPFETDNDFSLMRAHLEVRPPSARGFRPDLPGELDRLVLRALEKRPDDRFQSCDEMASALVAMPGFETLRGYASVPGIPLNEEPPPPLSPQGRAQPPETLASPPVERPSARQPRTRSSESSPELARREPMERPAQRPRPPPPRAPEARQRKRPVRVFPIFLAVFAAALVGVVVWWVIGRQRNDGQIWVTDNDVRELQDDKPADLGEELGTGQEAVEAAQLNAEDCTALVGRVADVQQLDQLLQTERQDLVRQLAEGTTPCRDLWYSTLGESRFDRLWRRTQVARLTIARYVLRTLDSVDEQEACVSFLTSNQAYQRAIEAIQSELASLQDIENTQMREMAAQLSVEQDWLAARYHLCPR